MVAQGIAEAVQAYTGLSAAAAVTILALMLATYLLMSSLFVAPEAASPSLAPLPKSPQLRQEGEQQQEEKEEQQEEKEEQQQEEKEEEQQEEKEEQQQEEKEEPGAFVPYPESVQLGEITLQQLAAYDGKDPSKPILIAIRGQVYDVSRGSWNKQHKRIGINMLVQASELWRPRADPSWTA